jgi:hypothetical protein
MNEPQDTEQAPAPTPYLRLPVPLVTAALVVFLGLLLGLGLYANANLRAQGIVVPTAVATAAVPSAAATVAQTPATSIPAPALPPTASPAPTQAVLATPVPSATKVPPVIVLATMTPATELAGTVVAPPSPTVYPALAAEVSLAYEHYWQVRADALLHLDKTHLTEAMEGDHLASTSHLIDELRDENRAIQTSVDHDYHVIEATNTSASVFDDYLSSSFYIDPVTLAPISQPASDELRVLYRFQQFDGVWKVVDSISAD